MSEGIPPIWICFLVSLFTETVSFIQQFIYLYEYYLILNYILLLSSKYTVMLMKLLFFFVQIRSEFLTSSSSLINQRHWTEEAADSHCAIPSYMMESNSPPPIASTGYENVSSSTDNSSDLCTIALLQIKYAFSMKQPSTDKQIRFYQSLSQICAKFIGGSERFSNDGDTGNQWQSLD